MMNPPDSDVTFEDLLPTIRAQYAYLECGRHILMKVFLWRQKLEDISNVKDFLLGKMSLSDYENKFTSTIKKNFENNEIRYIDITGLWELFQAVSPLFQGRAGKKVDFLLDEIRKERNKIIHNIFLKKTVAKEEVITELNKVHNLVEKILISFEGEATADSKSDVRDYVSKIINNASKGNNEVTLDTSSVEGYYLDFIVKVIDIAGKPVNLNIQHHGSGDVNVTRNVINQHGCVNYF